MIYLDFSKAFDKLDHGVLHKLRDMGIAGNLGIWFHSVLSNCYHFVRLEGGSSTAGPVISRVPRGIVLGPLLFLILMSDIGVLNAKVVSFADATLLNSGLQQKAHQIIMIEKIQKAFTKHNKRFSSFSYQERLSNVKVYSLQRRKRGILKFIFGKFWRTWFLT